MTPFKQLTRTDCLRTAIACLLDVPPAEIPMDADHQMNLPDRLPHYNEILAGYRLRAVLLFSSAPPYEMVAAISRRNPDASYVLVGEGHAVAVAGGEVYDPSPTPRLLRALEDGGGSAIILLTYVGRQNLTPRVNAPIPVPFRG